MRLKKDKIIRELTDKNTIELFLQAGWEEVKAQPKADKKAEKEPEIEAEEKGDK